MASNSRRKSGSSGSSNPRRRVVIGAQETLRVRYDKDQPQVEAERKGKSSRASQAARGSKSSGASKAPRASQPEKKRVRKVEPNVHKPHRLPTSHQGRRLSASKREERERRQAIIRAKRVVIIAGAIAAIAACIWGVIAFTQSDSFAVTEVRVEGVRHLDPSVVTSMAAVRLGDSLFRIDRDDIERRIESDPWVSVAEVSRDFPHTVVVSVTERVPAAVVDAGAEKLWVVSRDGYWLGERGVDESATVVIRDLEEVRPEPGKKVRSKVLANAVGIVSHLSDEMLARIRLVSAPSIEKTALITTDGIQIYIGENERVEEKERIARAILDKEKGRVVYINVRVVESPTWRGLTK